MLVKTGKRYECGGTEGPWDHLNEVSILLRGIASSEKHAMPSLAYRLVPVRPPDSAPTGPQ